MYKISTMVLKNVVIKNTFLLKILEKNSSSDRTYYFKFIIIITQHCANKSGKLVFHILLPHVTFEQMNNAVVRTTTDYIN